jgi:predicted DsbA family dithiol-disulfide isomerase
MLKVDYFSDVLCVWAFVNEKRLEEVDTQLGHELDIQMHFLPNFASVHPKINAGWENRGGFSGYADHVNEVAEQFGIDLHKDTWAKVMPSTSITAHTFIKAVQAVHGYDQARRIASALRSAFFLEAKDISKVSVCESIVSLIDIALEPVKAYLETGQAYADLHMDFKRALDYQISVSPAWVFNDGRQKLIGNVGYRVIESNLKELINAKPLEQNWC